MFSGIPVGGRPGGRAAAWMLRLVTGAGLIAIAVAWAQASATVQVSEQVDWAPVALAGTTAVVFGLLASVLVARQAVAIRLGRLATLLSAFDAAVAAGTPAAQAAPGGSVVGPGRNGTAGAGTLVAAARMARYHTGTCPLAAGKPVRAASRGDHERAGRRPCGVCCP